jgi:hypothetical protein
MKSVVDVIEVKPLHDYRLWLRFEDGLEGEIDLENELIGRVFEPLREPSAFAQVRVDREIGTIVWPNGADMAPETLYELIEKNSTATRPAAQA